MPVLNLDPVFRQYLDDHTEVETLWRPREKGGHLSELGNKVVADAIHQLMQERGLLEKPLSMSMDNN